MRRKLPLIAILAMLAAFAPPALAVDTQECFSSDNERRISGCSAIIETPGVAPDTLGSAYAMRALAYALKGQYDVAIGDYNRAIGLVPDFPVALNNRAWAYFKWGRAAQGLPDVEKSLRLDPTSPHSYDTRAHIRQWMGDSASALRDYEAAMRFGGSRMIKLYQCGLNAAKLYNGEMDGFDSAELRRAMKMCVQAGSSCDPLPPDEECRAVTS